MTDQSRQYQNYISRQEHYRVIVFGIGGTLKDAIGYIRLRFDIVGCSDSNPAKADNDIISDVPFYEKAKLASVDCDYILLVSAADSEIKEDLIRHFHIPEEKLLLRNQWDRMAFHYSYGNKNPDKTFYVLSKPIRKRNGIYSINFSFLDQLGRIGENGYIPVIDMQSFESQYLLPEKVGKVNAWDQFYEPLSPYTVDGVYQSQNVIAGFDSNYYVEDFEKKYDYGAYKAVYQKYFHLNPAMTEAVEAEYVRLFSGRGKVLGVLFRGTDMNALHLPHHAVQPSAREMIELVRKRKAEWECDSIYLTTESEEAVQAFLQAFGDAVFFTDQARFSDTGDKWLANIHFERENDPYLRGKEYIITISLLSKCSCMVGGICAASLCAPLQKKGEYEHMEFVNKGYF